MGEIGACFIAPKTDYVCALANDVNFTPLVLGLGLRYVVVGVLGDVVGV